MSGIFNNGCWFENTDMICKRCGHPVYETEHIDYSYQCFHCEKNLYEFEVEERSGLYLPKVIVARPLYGIPLNTEIEYLLNENEEIEVFKNQADAEAYLTFMGFSDEDIDMMYFIDVEEMEEMENGTEA